MEGRETDVHAEVTRRNDDERNKVRLGGLGNSSAFRRGRAGFRTPPSDTSAVGLHVLQH